MNVRAYLQTRTAREPVPAIGWAIREGRAMAAAVREWSAGERRLIRLVEHRLRAPWGHCFGSAQRATLLAEALGTGRHEFVYCEGFASTPDLPAPFAHAWCLLNGQVWDPTPQFRELRVEYFGREITTAYLRRAVARRQAWGPVMLSPLPPVLPPTG
ncbi:MAG: hypothetical protein ACRDFT_10600 [bacterium]